MDITISSAVIVAIIVGLTEVIKKATGMKKKFIPLLSVALGLALAVAYSFTAELTVPYIIFYGLIMGLSACGLFSGSKSIIEGFKKEE